MSKYHTIVGIDPVGNQELDILEFIQRATEDNIVYLYVSGDEDIPSLSYGDIPDCECPVDEDGDKDCMCEFDEILVARVTKYYTDLGFDVQVINMGSFISSLD